MSNPKSSVRSGSESAADAAIRFPILDGALQGNLFEAPEPSTQPAAALTSESAAASHDLSDDELGADAALDALTGLADVAATSNFCAPELTNNRELTLSAAQHPVVEQLLVERSFTPNDLSLGSSTDLVVLTGPNASEKSCYLRQIGLIQLMAQVGSWVPAKQAKVGIADRIFTRVSAVDELAASQSTFMVEMAETTNILYHATSRSLVLLDEIGRGTATFDSLSIAWAVSEHLAGELKARTVFATYYHELNALAG